MMDGHQKMLALFLLWISGVSGEYLFTLPRVLEAGSTTSFCLLLNEVKPEGFIPERGYTVTVGLKYMSRDNENTRTTESQTATFGIVNQDGDFQKCQEVQAPQEDGSYSAVVNASMTYTPDGTVSEVTLDIFGAEQNIEARRPDLITLVQTDKPIYKPGQTVKFRVMTMDYMLMSRTDGYQLITIESPNGLRVMQWDNVPSPNGLVSLKMKLSSDPVLGSWTIKVLYGAKEIVQAFKVDEYVLPKFEVTITPPKYLLPTTKQISGTVCAKYTYGKSVKGTLKMRLCYKPDYIRYYGQRDRPCANVIEKIDGCYEFFINAEDIKLGHRLYSSWGSLLIDANVTEDQTGIELSGHSSGPRMTMYPLNLRMEDDTDNYFKPSFPYNGRVVVTNPDGSPAPGERIRVEGTSSYSAVHLWANNFTSDENGIVHFVITEFDSSIGLMNLQANAIVYESDWRYTDDEIYVRTYTPSAYLRLTKWYSPSNSYLYMADVDEAVDCDSELTLDVLFTADAGKDYKFMTIVKAGDAIVYTDEKRVNADDNIWNLDILSFDENQLLKKELKPTVPPPFPTIPPLPTLEPVPFEGDKDGEDVYTYVYEESEVFQPLSEETPRKKRADGGCVQDSMRDEAFMGCIMGYSNFMSSMNPTDQKVMMSAMCSEEGLAAVQCIFDYLKTCPELLTSGDSSMMFLAFNDIEKIGGYDVICNQSPGGKSNLVGHFKQTIPVRKEMSPNAKVLVFYMREDKEVVATSLEFKVKTCFKNKVMMSFDETTVRPGANVNLNLGASPSSTCFVGMVDKSVNLLGGNNQLTPKQVFENVRQVARPYHYISYWEEDRNYCNEKMDPPAPEDYYSYSYFSPDGVDAVQAFRDVNLWVVTDARLETRPCKRERHYYYSMSRQLPFDAPGSPGSDLVVPKGLNSEPAAIENSAMGVKSDPEPAQNLIRTFFPETWLWDTVTLGDDGTLSMETKIPDTITEWVGNTVCTHASDGVGVTELSGVTAFKPFFVSLTLPYSAVRGEVLPILATVFNYLSDCITLKVKFWETEGFEFSDMRDNSREFCLCGGESESTKFYIVPTVIGEIDIQVTAVSTDNFGLCENVVMGGLGPGVEDGVQRQLLIEAEGIPRDQTKSSYTCVTDGEINTEIVEMNLPPDMVLDSERATVSVVGDIMGPTLSNLKNLLKMPYGCGEQNMASWSPNIYVLQYLDNTDQLTEELEEEAEGYMQVGYQRQMKYRHHDNSYSAWGDNQYQNATGSSWLTAFVVKSMAQSSAYIVIDNDDILRSARWLVNTQQEDGCFPQVGRVFSSYLKGGLEGDNPAGLTAFTLIALLEANLGMEFQQNISFGFSSCLDNFDVASTDTYTLTLMLYAYTVYDIDGARRAEVMEELNGRRVNEDGLSFWRRNDEEPKKDDYYWWYRAPSAEVEMTAYVLMSILVQGEDVIGDVQPIVQWLTRQRNPYGGFSSTQDTVVALQALAEFGKFTYSGSTAVTVVIKNSAFGHIFSVSASNSLVYQSVEVNPSQGAVEITTSGTGCALVQVNMKYNIYTEEDAGPAFDVKVRVFRSRTNMNNCAMRTLEVCTSYLKGGVSNMAIAEVKMPTGWKPVTYTLNELVQSDIIQKFEVDNNYVQLYFDEFSKMPSCVDFDVEQEIEMKPKPALVRVYDYYEAGYSVTVNYTIKTTCGTKEEIPLDNEGLDCSIMQCRVLDTPKPRKLTCPSCLYTVENSRLEQLVCDAEAVYKATVRRSGAYSVKLMADLRPKKKHIVDKFANYKMYEPCSCPILETGPETKAFIFSTGSNFLNDEEEIRLEKGQTVLSYQASYERTIRKLASRKKLCDKLNRLRRSETKMNTARLQRLRRKFGVL